MTCSSFATIVTVTLAPSCASLSAVASSGSTQLLSCEPAYTVIGIAKSLLRLASLHYNDPPQSGRNSGVVISRPALARSI